MEGPYNYISSAMLGTQWGDMEIICSSYLQILLFLKFNKFVEVYDWVHHIHYHVTVIIYMSSRISVNNYS